MRLVTAAAIDPDPGQAHDWLRRELSRPEYQDRSWLERIVDWLQRTLDRAIGSAASMSPVATAAAVLVVFLLVVGIVLLVGRVRRRGVAATVPEAVLPVRRISADEHRSLAHTALAAGDTVTAALEAFRALAMRMVEADQLPDLPGATAGELARRMGTLRPDLADPVARGARLFDSARFSDHVPDQEAVRELLDTDRRLQGVLR